jgi:hypothetical protein
MTIRYVRKWIGLPISLLMPYQFDLARCQDLRRRTSQSIFFVAVEDQKESAASNWHLKNKHVNDNYTLPYLRRANMRKRCVCVSIVPGRINILYISFINVAQFQTVEH